MDLKWIAITMIVLFGGMFVGVSYEAHTKAECRIAFAQSNKTADEIVKICGK